MVLLIISDCHGNTGAEAATLRPQNTTTIQQQWARAQFSDVELWPHYRNIKMPVLLSGLVWWCARGCAEVMYCLIINPKLTAR